MPSQAIQSRVIRWVSFEEGKGLTVEFVGGNRYRYAVAPFREWLNMVNSRDCVRYYNEKIKGNYVSEKLLPGQA